MCYCINIQASVPSGSHHFGLPGLPWWLRSPGLLLSQEFGDVILVRRARERRVGGSLGETALFNQGRQSSGVDASRNILPWLDLIASGTVSLDPKGRWDGTLVPFGGMLGRVGLFLLPREAAGYPRGIFVRKSDLSLEQLANVFLCMSR